ncbi:MAG: uroporphyrinogen decarboxylase family protein [Candidatus Bathyarchaeia archaeon]
MNMTPLDRIKIAMAHEESDRVPLAIFASEYLARLGGYSVPEFCKDPEKILMANRAFIERYGNDCVWCWTDTWFMQEGWGLGMKWYSDRTPSPTGPLIKDPEEYYGLEVLDPFEHGRMPIILKALELASKEFGDMGIITGAFGPIELISHLRGWTASMRDLIMHPEAVHEACGILMKTVIEFYKACKDCGANVVFLQVARNDATMLSKKHVKEFGIRYEKPILNELKRMGIPVILHLCNTEPMIELLLKEYPENSWQGLQWGSRISNLPLAKAKRDFGDRIALVAGLDNIFTLPLKSPREVEEEAKDAIKTAARGGGFILSTDCEIPFDTPDDNLLAIKRVIEKYGNYPINFF